MPVITVTAATAGSDTLTAVGHGLTNGDRFHLRNIGGALPAATPGLTPATDFFARRVDADTLNVYDTNAHAVAGGATGLVDITGALGAGTTTIEYGLPYCIPTAIAVAGASQVKAANDNGTWAALVAIYNLLVGLTQSVWSAITFAVAVTFGAGATAAANQHFTVSGTGEYKHGSRTRVIAPKAWVFTNPANWTTIIDVSSAYLKSTASDNVLIELPVVTGDRILGVSYAAFGDGAVDATSFVQIATGNSGAAGTTIGSVTDTNHAASWSDVALAGPFTTHVMAAGELAFLQVTPNATNYRIGRILLTYDRP